METTVDTALVKVPFDGRTLDIEYQWIAARRKHRPLVVFLHEGLGSVSMWRDFPRKLCEAGRSRAGFLALRLRPFHRARRRSSGAWISCTARRARRCRPCSMPWRSAPDAATASPGCWATATGGSIALIHAASFPDDVDGLTVLAPHIMVEDISVHSIAATRETYLHTDLRARLARHHAHVDSAFWGWNDIWLNADFRHWDLRPMLDHIRCPVLAVQGEDDEYGTMAQIEGIHRYAPQTVLLKLARCGHSPHRDQAGALTAASAAFITAHTSTLK